MWKVPRKSRIRRKPQKIDQTGIKIKIYIKLIGLITAILVLITGIITLVDKCGLSDQKHVPDQIEVPDQKQVTDTQPPPEVPLPEKTETIRLNVIPNDNASASAFDGDVQITLSKVIDTYQQVFLNIMVYSSGEPMRSFEELTPFDPPQKIGSYEITVVKTGYNYAEFRIVRRRR